MWIDIHRVCFVGTGFLFDCINGNEPLLLKPKGRTTAAREQVDKGKARHTHKTVTAVALVLIVLSFKALWDTIVLVQGQVQTRDLTRAIIVGVDTVFLTVILLELLHTVVGLEPRPTGTGLCRDRYDVDYPARSFPCPHCECIRGEHQAGHQGDNLPTHGTWLESSPRRRD